MNQYEAKKATEFKNKIVIYLEAIMQLQQEVRDSGYSSLYYHYPIYCS